MGTAGVGTFNDDVAADVRREYLELLASGANDAKALATVLRSCKSALRDPDDAPVVWIALAATQWEYGRLTARVKAKALQVIDRDEDARRWAGSPLAVRRGSILVRLRRKLVSKQPARRKPPQTRLVRASSFTVQGPRSGTQATAWEINRTTCQVYVTLKTRSGEGGGGVFTAACALEKIGLRWTGTATLVITYPRRTAVSQRETTTRFGSHTVTVRYRSKS